MRLLISFLGLVPLLLPAPASAQELLVLRNGKFDEIHASGNNLWLGIGIVGGTGLYRFDENAQKAQHLRPSCGIDSVEALDGDGTLIYIGDRSGNLFRLRSESQCEKVVDIGPRIRAVAWDSNRNRLWIAAADGLYTWSASGIQNQGITAFKAKALRVVGGTLWLGTEQGLWKLGDKGFEQQDLSTDLNRAEINAVDIAAGQVWFGNHEHGLFRWPLGEGHQPIPVAFGANQVASLYHHGSSLFIGSQNGLFRVNVADTLWDPKVRLAELDPRNSRSGERLQLKWEITNFERRTSRDLVGQRVELLDSSSKVVAQQQVNPGVFETVLHAPEEAGEYRLRFVASDLTGREAFSEPVGASFSVGISGSYIQGGWVLAAALLLVGVFLGVATFRRRGHWTLDQARRENSIKVPDSTPVAESSMVRHVSRPGAGPSSGSPQRRLKVFLCHSSTDKPQVRGIYSWLQDLRADPWLDHEKILAGQDWEREITVAVPDSDAVLVCLSQSSVTKGGYLQKELRFALEVAEQQPEGTLFLIPVKLEECQPPIRLRHLHWVNLFEEEGYEHLFAALQARADSLGIRFGRESAHAAGGDSGP